MSTKKEIIEVLRPVQDPELHRSIVDLDMVRAIEVTGEEVLLLIALTVAGCPMKEEITQRVTEAVLSLESIAAVKVDFTTMTDEERAQLRTKLGHAGAAHGNIRQSPFATGASRSRVISVQSGKGGVGKSSIAVNLAVALAAQGAVVGILDADVYGFSVPRMIGVDHPPTVIDDSLILPPEAHGVRVVSMGFFVDEDRPVMWRGPMLHKAMEQFLVDVHWGDDLEFLVVDMPPGTGDINISMAQFLPTAEILVVTTPQSAAQTVAQRAGFMAEKVNQDVIGVIENMSWFELADGSRRMVFGEGGGAELAKALEVPLLGQVPLDEALRIGSDIGEPVVVTDPENPAARAILEIAGLLAEKKRRKIRRPELKISTV